MVDALADVQQSLDRIASSGKVGPAFSLLGRLKGFIDRGVADQQAAFSCVRSYTAHVREVIDIMNDRRENNSEMDQRIKAYP